MTSAETHAYATDRLHEQTLQMHGVARITAERDGSTERQHVDNKNTRKVETNTGVKNTGQSLSQILCLYCCFCAMSANHAGIELTVKRQLY